jgi:hypothetical protein
VCDNGFQSLSEQFVGNNTGSNSSGTAVEGGSTSPSPSEGQKKNAGVINVASGVILAATVMIMASSF